MKFRHLLLGSAFALALPATALAQSTISEGFYIGAYTGASWLNDFDLGNGTVDNRVTFDEDWTGGLEAGYRLGSGLRLGVDVGYSDHTVDSIVGGGGGGDGDLNAWTYMATATYEFDTGAPIRPYIGVGAGLATIDYDNVNPFFGTGDNIDDKDSAFAYQAHAGLIYQAAPNLDLTLGYRYIDSKALSYQTDAGLEVEEDYQNHSVLVGVRWVFGSTPAPAPVAQPAPEPVQQVTEPVVAPPPAISRNYTVFFDWDEATLTPQAEQVLQNVAKNAEAGSIMTIEIVGHADTSGAADYNQRLSLRRAEAVREFLISQGMQGNQVDVQGRGETELLVETPDGVREPSNRRAVILFP